MIIIRRPYSMILDGPQNEVQAEVTESYNQVAGTGFNFEATALPNGSVEVTVTPERIP